MKYDAIVIGAGILGISHAYHIAQTGRSVLLLEKNKSPLDASVRNFGQIVPSGFGSKWQQYGIESLKHYQDIAQLGDTTIRNEGTLYVASNELEMSLLEELRQINQTNDYESHLFTKKQCLDRIPSLQENYVKGGLFFPQELVIDPYTGIPRILEICTTHFNIELKNNTAVTSIENRGKDILVASSRGEKFYAEKVFICNGKEVNLLYPEIFYNSDLVLVKLQMLEVATKASSPIPGALLTGLTIRRYEAFEECDSFSKIVRDQDAYHQKYGIHILFKQLVNGHIILGDSHEYYSVANGHPDFFTDEAINEYIHDAARQIVRMDSKVVRSWLGIYTQCEKQDILHLEVEENIHIITGIGGKGMTASLGYAKEHISSIYK